MQLSLKQDTFTWDADIKQNEVSLYKYLSVGYEYLSLNEEYFSEHFIWPAQIQQALLYQNKETESSSSPNFIHHHMTTKLRDRDFLLSLT